MTSTTPHSTTDEAATLQLWRGVERAEWDRAQLAAPYADDAKVAAMTAEVVEAGRTLFQIHRLHQDERQHVAKLLEAFALPQGATVLDLGCGVGTMAAHMKALRPDLEITLLNISPSQLERCPPEFEQWQGDFHHVPLQGRQFDAVMVCYALGHARLEEIAKEIGRLVKPFGQALFFDLFTFEYAPALTDRLGYVAYLPARLADELALHHLHVEDSFEPVPAIPEQWVLDDVGADTFANVAPLIMRFRKE